MAPAEGLEGIFFPSPLPNPTTQQMMTELKQMSTALRKSQSSQSLQHQLFLQAQCEMFSAPMRGRDASKVIKGLEMRRGGELGLPSLEEVQGDPALCVDSWWREHRKQNWNILSAGTG